MDGIMKLIIRMPVCNAVGGELWKFLNVFWSQEEQGKADDVRSGRDGISMNFFTSSFTRPIMFYIRSKFDIVTFKHV
jgi:hypothetical protein